MNHFYFKSFVEQNIFYKNRSPLNISFKFSKYPFEPVHTIT